MCESTCAAYVAGCALGYREEQASDWLTTVHVLSTTKQTAHSHQTPFPLQRGWGLGMRLYKREVPWAKMAFAK